MEKMIHSSNNCKFLCKHNAGRILYFDNHPSVVSSVSVVGTKEGKGNFSKYFDMVLDDDKINEKSFEKAELDIFELLIQGILEKAQISLDEIDMFIAGDLMNQITSANYTARSLFLPYLGIYSACATMGESLILSAILANSNYCSNIICGTVSHFATAERQYRYPLEYGCQRPPYAQWTVTGGGCCLISNNINSQVKLTKAIIGKVVDFGTNDLSNMGAAMAPAAMDTLTSFFTLTQTNVGDYDLIVTGDLGKLGSDILRDLMSEKGFELGNNYMDCGASMYSLNQKCYQGGSGAGCSASIFSSFVLNKMNKNIYKKVLFLPTGALMSAMSCYQGESIPGICHGVLLEVL